MFAKVEGGVATLTGSGFTIKLPLNGRIDSVFEQVVVGIHPEDLTDPLTEAESFTEMPVQEPLGNELIVYADCNGERAVANLGPHHHIDSTIKLSPNLNCVRSTKRQRSLLPTRIGRSGRTTLDRPGETRAVRLPG